MDIEKPSSFSPTDRYYIGRAQDAMLTDEEKKTILRDFFHSNIRLPDLQQKAEILAFCGMRAYELGMIDDSGYWLQSASDLFDICKDQHRYAVVLWMLFIWRRAKGQYRLAYDHARRGVRIFTDKQNECKRIKNKNKESWYQGRIVEMTSDLVSSPEDMFELLFEFQGTALSSSVSDIKNRISNRLERKEFSGINQEIDLLLGIANRSGRPEETAEAFAFIGVVNWVLENSIDAYHFFRSAMALYIPASFEYSIIQWMAGLVLFSRETARAIHMMEKSIQDFDVLRQEAIHQNKMDRRDWFAGYQMAMKRVLRKRVEDLKL